MDSEPTELVETSNLFNSEEQISSGQNSFPSFVAREEPPVSDEKVPVPVYKATESKESSYKSFPVGPFSIMTFVKTDEAANFKWGVNYKPE